MQISKFSWAKPLTLSVAKEHAVAQFLWWIVTAVVNVILRSFFYVTELDHQPRTKVDMNIIVQLIVDLFRVFSGFNSCAKIWLFSPIPLFFNEGVLPEASVAETSSFRLRRSLSLVFLLQ